MPPPELAQLVSPEARSSVTVSGAPREAEALERLKMSRVRKSAHIETFTSICHVFRVDLDEARPAHGEDHDAFRVLPLGVKPGR
ncbi:MAG TPA: hypothetical protein VLL75_15180 [Vicinamibacteria bacterium]|nr:hypothetical protein [Vicinamibacteria bacterium]